MPGAKFKVVSNDYVNPVDLGLGIEEIISKKIRLVKLVDA
jgi:hypothetical protein